MRIAIDMLMAEKEPGGMQFASFSLLEGLARIETDNEFYVITARPQNYQFVSAAPHMHVHYVHLLTESGLMIQHQLLMPEVLHHLKPDVLHVPAFVAPIGWHGPLVVTVHDLAFVTDGDKDGLSLAIRLYWECMLRESVRRAQRVIAVSEKTRAELVEHWSVEEERIAMIHNALRSSLPYGRVTADQKESIQELYGARYLLHVGRIIPHKNVETLVEAFSLLAAQDAGLNLVLVGGSGQGSAGVRRQIAVSPFSERIHLAGWVTDDELGVLYAGASALVFPSRHEGFGLPTLEAMAFGLPVVASPEAASEEIAENAVLRADCSDPKLLADALTQILTDTALREHLIALGSERAQKFSVEGCAQATCEVYKQAAAHHGLTGHMF